MAAAATMRQSGQRPGFRNARLPSGTPPMRVPDRSRDSLGALGQPRILKMTIATRYVKPKIAPSHV